MLLLLLLVIMVSIIAVLLISLLLLLSLVVLVLVIYIYICVFMLAALLRQRGRRNTPGLHNKIPAFKIFARGWVAQICLFHWQRLRFARGWVRKDGNLVTETGCNEVNDDAINLRPVATQMVDTQFNKLTKTTIDCLLCLRLPSPPARQVRYSVSRGFANRGTVDFRNFIVVFGPRPWHIEIRHRVKKESSIN